MTSLRNPVALALGGLLVVAAIGVNAGSLAAFTDTAAGGPTFTSGTVVLDATRSEALDVAVGRSWLPGDSVTGSVDVENDGTNPLRYSLATTTTSAPGPNGGVLGTVLLVEVRTIDMTTPASRCTEFDGAVLTQSEALGDANVLFGTVASTDGSGDRTVLPGATDVLCIRLSLPLATGNAFQGATVVSTFTFNAEQTAND